MGVDRAQAVAEGIGQLKHVPNAVPDASSHATIMLTPCMHLVPSVAKCSSLKRHPASQGAEMCSWTQEQRKLHTASAVLLVVKGNLLKALEKQGNTARAVQDSRRPDREGARNVC